MNEPIIQKQISLVAFKATKVNIDTKGLQYSSRSEPKFNLDLKNVLFKDDEKLFAKVFLIDLVTNFGNEEITYKVEFQTIFQCQEKIDEAFLNSEFAMISAPAIGFPFVRSFISTLSLQAGLPPVILPSINFVQLNKQMGGSAPESAPLEKK